MALIKGYFEKISLNLEQVIGAEFAAAAVLCTLGVVLGKVSWTQFFVLSTFEIIFFGLNATICGGMFGAVDMGGSMYVHTFGTYFGLGATYFFHKNKAT
jgi:ammonium transporter Rh